MSTAIRSKELAKKFQDWLYVNRISLVQIVDKCNGAIAQATLSNLKNYGYATKFTVEVFLEAYPGENKEEWLVFFNDDEKAA